MAKVIITKNLEKEIHKKFKKESITIFELMLNLESHPKKGKEIGTVGSIIIKEIKCQKFRFYFITDKFKIKFLKSNELTDLIIKFVRMSDKKTQQRTINDIKQILKNIGREGF
jgi:hypothetical protein